jgi:hypothetical protein
MKLSIYKSILTDKKTVLVASKGNCGYANYQELQIYYFNGRFEWYLGDGYRHQAVGRGDSLKEILNLFDNNEIRC